MNFPNGWMDGTMALLILCSSVSAGCSSQEARYAATIIGYNHTSNGIIEYTVKIDEGEAVSGLSLRPHSGGGGFVCCINVPVQWHDKMNVIVHVTEVVEGKEREREVIVPMPEFDSDYMTYLNVHFLRNESIKVFLAGTTISSKNYPLQGAEANLGLPK
jgi:hypothetical protein